MSGKSRFSYRFLFYLFTFCIFLLILSSVSLVQFPNSHFIPRSMFKLILVNSTSLFLKPDAKSEPVKFPLSPSTDTNLAMRCGGLSSPNSKVDASGCHRKKTCGRNQPLRKLKVYMYDLPPEFHFRLLGWKGKTNQTWPNVDSHSRIPPYPGGLNLQHSVEYWLTLDLLASNTPKVGTAVRVQNSSQADIVFVPFFSSLSYNRHSKLHGKEKVSVNKMLQNRLLQFLMARDEWKRFGGKDHLLVAHHPNSILQVRKKLGSAMFVLADFGRYPVEIANLGKDIIAPYKHVVRTIPSGESAQFDHRPILMHFQGSIYRKDDSLHVTTWILIRIVTAPSLSSTTATFQSSYRPPHNSIFNVTTIGTTTSASSTCRYRPLILSSKSVNNNINGQRWTKGAMHRFVLCL